MSYNLSLKDVTRFTPMNKSLLDKSCETSIVKTISKTLFMDNAL